jgi:hypothetical protein
LTLGGAIRLLIISVHDAEEYPRPELDLNKFPEDIVIIESLTVAVEEEQLPTPVI